MPKLYDMQRAVRNAVVSGDVNGVGPLLVGGGDPARRLAVHHRHYRASLVDALLTRFPALTWLVGSDAIGAAADRYVREHPPLGPCMSEYGETFPTFVAGHVGRPDLGYVQPFGDLEWLIGVVSIAIDAAVPPLELYRAAGEALASATVIMQPGVRYFRAAWPVHDLMKGFLTGTAPDVYEMSPADTWVEIRGARGDFEITDIDTGTWTFRSELQRGRSLEAAAMTALAVDERFDPGSAFTSVVRAGLITDIRTLVERAF